MSKSFRGDCPLCKRKNVHMPGPKCSRCYSRLAKGRDILTNQPISSPEGSTAKQPIPPPLPKRQSQRRNRRLQHRLPEGFT